MVEFLNTFHIKLEVSVNRCDICDYFFMGKYVENKPRINQVVEFDANDLKMTILVNARKLEKGMESPYPPILQWTSTNSEKFYIPV